MQTQREHAIEHVTQYYGVIQGSRPRSGHTLTAAFTVLTELCDPSPKETKIGTTLWKDGRGGLVVFYYALFICYDVSSCKLEWILSHSCRSMVSVVIFPRYHVAPRRSDRRCLFRFPCNSRWLRFVFMRLKSYPFTCISLFYAEGKWVRWTDGKWKNGSRIALHVVSMRKHNRILCISILYFIFSYVLLI